MTTTCLAGARIRALEVLQCYSYQFDTDAAVVEVVRGEVAGPVYRTAEKSIYAVDITLNRLLSPPVTLPHSSTAPC